MGPRLPLPNSNQHGSRVVGPHNPVHKYGQQKPQQWEAGDNKPRSLVDVGPHGEQPKFWRVAVSGENLICRILWGTAEPREIEVNAPFSLDLPGNVTVYGRPATDDAAASAFPSLTLSDGCGPWSARRLFTFVALSIQLPAEAARFVALNACTLTVRGIAVALTAGQSIPLCHPSTLGGGTGFAEFEP